MSDFESLAATLKERPILSVDSDLARADLISLADGERILMDHDDRVYRAIHAVHVEKSLRKFGRLAGERDREFSLPEIAEITGLPYKSLDDWLRQGIIRTTVDAPAEHGKERRFRWRDAFIAGALAHLRRGGISLPMLRNVAGTLYAAAQQQEVLSGVE